MHIIYLPYRALFSTVESLVERLQWSLEIIIVILRFMVAVHGVWIVDDIIRALTPTVHVAVQQQVLLLYSNM